MMRFLVLAAATMLCGCATIARGTAESWSIKSTPPGASVRTSTDFACDATPCTFMMPRKSEFDVTVTMTGYKTWHGRVSHHMAGGGGAGFLGNALVGGVIGAGIDLSSGAMMDLAPNPMDITLEKEAPPPAPRQIDIGHEILVPAATGTAR